MTTLDTDAYIRGYAEANGIDYEKAKKCNHEVSRRTVYATKNIVTGDIEYFADAFDCYDTSYGRVQLRDQSHATDVIKRFSMRAAEKSEDQLHEWTCGCDLKLERSDDW